MPDEKDVGNDKRFNAGLFSIVPSEPCGCLKNDMRPCPALPLKHWFQPASVSPMTTDEVATYLWRSLN
jgi:hypothetical protein